jgi:Putative Flp pilus-assembly TadE/G-like
MVFMVALVVDVANWYEHKRHLQLQADAAALAGAHSISIGSCSDTLIANDTRRYGGSDSPDGVLVRAQPFNDQVGGTGATHLHLLINSSGYYGDTGAGDNTDPNGSPCASKYVDVKVTETDLPWFFGGLVPKISAHARVGLVQESQSNGSLPIAVPNPLPTSAAAIFINEGDGSILDVKPLTHVGPSGPLDMWSNAGNSASITIPSSGQASVVIALSGRQSMMLTGGLAAICDQPLTDCYDASADPPVRGLTFIRGYSVSGSGAQPNSPILRSVELFNVDCANTPYFSNNAGNCTYEIVARIDAGVGLPKANQIYTANGIALTSGTDPNCALVAGSDQCWHGNLTLPAGSAANNITMTWEETTGCLDAPCGQKGATQCSTSNGNKCKGTFAGVAQRAYSAKVDNSGPIQVVRLFRCDSDPSCSVPDFQSYPTGETHTFVVSIGIAGTLQNATSPSSPIVALRVMQENPHTQSLDCDPGYSNLKQELASGCRPSYIPNGGTPDCTTLGASALWATAQPWSCVAVQTGGATNDPAAGLNQRIYGDQNPPNSYPACANGLGNLGYNNWANYDPNDPTGYDGFPPGDPRILNAFLTTYGAFSHITGSSGSVPVIGFGHFYVTGYVSNGGGFSPPTNCNMDPVPGNDPGVIVGRFIRYVDRLGGTGTQPCDPNSINSCVIVMTK